MYNVKIMIARTAHGALENRDCVEGKEGAVGWEGVRGIEGRVVGGPKGVRKFNRSTCHNFEDEFGRKEKKKKIHTCCLLIFSTWDQCICTSKILYKNKNIHKKKNLT